MMETQLDPNKQKFTRLVEERLSESQGIMRVWREEYFTRFATEPLPTRKNEAWHYTDISPIFRTDYQLDPADRAAEVTSLPQVNEPGFHVFFVNGAFANSQVIPEGALPKGLSINPLSELDDKQIESLYLKDEQHRSRMANALADLNGSLVRDGYVIHVADGLIVDRPIWIHFLMDSKAVIQSHVRNFIVVGKDAKVTVVEKLESAQGQAWHNSVTEVEINERAKLAFAQSLSPAQGSHCTAQTFAFLKKQAELDALSLIANGDLVRNEVSSYHEAEEAHSRLRGLTIGRDKQVLDQRSQIFHQFAKGTSEQLYRSLLAGQSRSVFNGKIYIAQDAQQVQSAQKSHSLLLSPKAEANAKPELEIFADDVKASHGATVGQMDEEALFYCASRGVSESVAKQLLAYGFARDVMEGFPDQAVGQILSAQAQKLLETLDVS